MYAQVARYCNCSADLILLSFVLGKASSSSPWYPTYHLPRPLSWGDNSESQNYPQWHRLEVNQSRLTRPGSCVPGQDYQRARPCHHLLDPHST